MTLIGLAQILIYFVIVAISAVLLGGYMAKVFQGERVFLSPVVRPIERRLLPVGGRARTRLSSAGPATSSPCCCSRGRVTADLSSFSACRAICRVNPDDQTPVNG